MSVVPPTRIAEAARGQQYTAVTVEADAATTAAGAATAAPAGAVAPAAGAARRPVTWAMDAAMPGS